MADARVGLEFDLSGFRAGVRSAAAIVKKGLGTAALSPFNKSLAKSVEGMKKAAAKVGGAFTKAGNGVGRIVKGLFSAKTLAVGLAAAVLGLATGAIAAKVYEFVEAARGFNDAKVILENSVRSAGISFDQKGLYKNVEAISSTLGIAQTELIKTSATLVGRGFSDQATNALLVYASNASQVTGKSVTDTAKIMADALNGSIDAVKELHLEIPITGDKFKDQITIANELASTFGEVGEQLVNPSQRINTIIDDIYVVIGEQILPLFEPMLEYVENLLLAWKKGALESQLKALIINAQAFGGALIDIGKVVLEVANTAIKAVKFVWSTIKGFGYGLYHGILDGIPYLFNKAAEKITQLIRAALSYIPGGETLLNYIGFDEHLTKAFREQAAEYGKAFSDGTKEVGIDFLQSAADVGEGLVNTYKVATGDKSVTGIFDTAVAATNKLAEKGQQIKEASKEHLKNIRKIAGEELLSAKAKTEEALKLQKVKEAATQKQSDRIEKLLEELTKKKTSIQIAEQGPNKYRTIRPVRRTR